MSETAIAIHVVTALAEEARPLIDSLGLERLVSRSPFPTYHNGDWWLSVSGIGKAASAAATALLFARAGERRRQVWLNIGVAGHRDLPVGQLVIADQLIDKATDRRWYPQVLIDPGCPRTSVCTVERVESEYRDQLVFEMEAAGFFGTAIRFSTAELIHVFKVVSDNRLNPVESLARARMGELVAAAVPQIERFGRSLAELAEEARPPSPDERVVGAFERRWHFTVTQRRQLLRILNRLEALEPGLDVLASVPPGQDTAAQVLRALRTVADGLPVRYSR